MTGANANLREYQQRGAKWLAQRNRALLADVMGLGKTAQAIEAARLLSLERVVVVAPAIAVENWKREFAKWAPNLDPYVTSYRQITTKAKIRKFIRDWRPEVLICDEAHFLKNRKSKRTKFVYGQGINCGQSSLAGAAERVWLISGTPAMRDGMDLYPHLRALWPELVTHGNDILPEDSFLRRYMIYRQTQFSYKVEGLDRKMLPELRLILDMIMLRRSLADAGLDVGMVWQPPYVLDTGAKRNQLAQYEASEEVDEIRRVIEAADDGNTRDLYDAADPIVLPTVRRLTAIIKAPEVANLIHSELSAGEYDKIVIFAFHREALDLAHERLSQFNAVRISGAETDAEQQAAVDQFTNDPSCRAAVIQQQIGSTALSLDVANQVAFIEQSWLHQDNVQAAFRCLRMTQTRTVFVRTFSLAGSVDEQVTATLTRRARMHSQLME